MRPPLVDQVSCYDEDYAFRVRAENAIACTAEEDRARQEFKDEADINWLLRKYGALPPVQSFPQGEVDYDLGLLDAKMAVDEARKAYEAFPRVLRENLSFDGFLQAVANNSFKVEPLKPADDEAPKSGASSADGGQA